MAAVSVLLALLGMTKFTDHEWLNQNFFRFLTLVFLPPVAALLQKNLILWFYSKNTRRIFAHASSGVCIDYEIYDEYDG